jgi:hypothetical protein
MRRSVGDDKEERTGTLGRPASDDVLCSRPPHGQPSVPRPGPSEACVMQSPTHRYLGIPLRIVGLGATLVVHICWPPRLSQAKLARWQKMVCFVLA